MQDTIVENIKVAMQMAKADHRMEGWTMVHLLADAAAQPNMDPKTGPFGVAIVSLHSTTLYT